MRRVLLTVEYNGKNYAGWQRQENALAVQQVLEDALSLLLQQKVVLFGSGRTDAGVHACGQKAHFDCEGNFPLDKIPVALTTVLPSDIAVLKAEEVASDFHAQYQAKRKTYVYKMYISRENHPLLNDTHAWISYTEDKFNVERAREACLKLIGTHDFAGFSNQGSPVRSTVRTIYDASLVQNGKFLTLTVCGNGFLYNMMRIIAGTLAYVGLGKRTPEDVDKILLSGDRTFAGKTYPAQGLCLYSVEYD